MSSAGVAFIRSWLRAPMTLSEVPAILSTAPLSDIYASHDAMVDCRYLASGGWKMGAVGLLPGVPCLSGPLFADFLVPENSSGTSPRVVDFGKDFLGTHIHTFEGEVGFRLSADVPPPVSGGQVSLDDCWSAVGSVMPCVELCGSRVLPSVFSQPLVWTLQHKLHDGLMSGGVLVGTSTPKEAFGRDGADAARNLSRLSCTLKLDGKTLDAGDATACPCGGPLESLTWLANHLHSRGRRLKSGDLVISGAVAKGSAKDVQGTKGSKVEVEFTGPLGKVGAAFVLHRTVPPDELKSKL